MAEITIFLVCLIQREKKHKKRRRKMFRTQLFRACYFLRCRAEALVFLPAAAVSVCLEKTTHFTPRTRRT